MDEDVMTFARELARCEHPAEAVAYVPVDDAEPQLEPLEALCGWDASSSPTYLESCARCGAVRLGLGQLHRTPWRRPALLDLLEHSLRAPAAVCQVHDAEDPVEGRICGHSLPCPEHSPKGGA